MGYKKVIFAGFFLNREEKLQFTRLFDCDKKYFWSRLGILPNIILS